MTNSSQNQDEARIKHLLQQALPPVDPAAEPSRDLWPAVLRRIDKQSATQSRWLPASIPLLDWALIAGLVAFAAFFPATIPVVLYYL